MIGEIDIDLFFITGVAKDFGRGWKIVKWRWGYYLITKNGCIFTGVIVLLGLEVIGCVEILSYKKTKGNYQ